MNDVRDSVILESSNEMLGVADKHDLTADELALSSFMNMCDAMEAMDNDSQHRLMSTVMSYFANVSDDVTEVFTGGQNESVH